MADYIRNNILFQAYVHAESEKIDDVQIKFIEEQLNEFIAKRARFFLSQNVEIDVKIGDGSLKSWATVLGTLSALYAGVANYPDFRAGVIALHDDVTRLSNAIVSESLFVTKTRHTEIIRIESRTGIIGSIKRIIDQIEFMREKNGSINAERMQKILNQTSIDINRVLDAIKNEDDLILIKKNLHTGIERLPDKPLPGRKEKRAAVYIQLYHNRRKSILQKLTG